MNSLIGMLIGIKCVACKEYQIEETIYILKNLTFVLKTMNDTELR